MPTVVVRRTLASDQLDAVCSPRDDVVAERPLPGSGPAGPGSEPAPGRTLHFGLAEGPFRRWERSVTVEAGAGDRRTVVEKVEFALAVPFWSLLFTPLMVLSLRYRRTGKTAPPWWAPPTRLDARASTVLGLLGLLGLFGGYMGTLLTQTNTFFGEDFGASDSELGWLQGLVRVGALASLGLVAVADRRGRRGMLLTTATLGCLATAAGGLAPDMVWLGVAQTIARACSMALAILVAVVAVEETPARARAYAISVLVMAAALGAGLAVMLLPVAGLGTGAWRVLFAVPLGALWPIALIARRLPETRRFLQSRGSSRSAPPRSAEARSVPALGPGGRWSGAQRARLLLLAASAFCLEMFVAPAAGFLNEHLRTEQGFSALQLTLFTILTNTPAGAGIVVGGRLADLRGRRLVGAIGLGVGTAFTVVVYLATGWGIWLSSLIGAVVGAVAIPALGVYSPELFPTSVRGRANGVVNLARVGGSFAGLVGAGLLSERLAGGLPSAMVLLAAGPALVVVLVLVLYPETKGVELEDLNPEDAPLSRELLEADGLDPDSSPGTWLHSGTPRALRRDPGR